MKVRKLLLFIIIFVQYKDNNKLIMIAIIIDARKKRNEDIPDSEIYTNIIVDRCNQGPFQDKINKINCKLYRPNLP